jgi:uncharacterized coiled-coil DUF342 family protein
LWSGSDDYSIRIWHVTSDEGSAAAAADRSDALVLSGHSGGVVAMTLSTKGLVWTGDSGGKLRVWRPGFGGADCLKEVRVDGGSIRHLSTVGDNVWCAAHHSILIFDGAEMSQLRKLAAHEGFIGWIGVIRRTETRVVWTSSMTDKSVRFWEATSVMSDALDDPRQAAEAELAKRESAELRLALDKIRTDFESLAVSSTQALERLEHGLDSNASSKLDEALQRERELHALTRESLESALQLEQRAHEGTRVVLADCTAEVDAKSRELLLLHARVQAAEEASAQIRVEAESVKASLNVQLAVLTNDLKERNEQCASLSSQLVQTTADLATSKTDLTAKCCENAELLADINAHIARGMELAAEVDRLRKTLEVTTSDLKAEKAEHQATRTDSSKQISLLQRNFDNLTEQHKASAARLSEEQQRSEKLEAQLTLTKTALAEQTKRADEAEKLGTTQTARANVAEQLVGEWREKHEQLSAELSELKKRMMSQGIQLGDTKAQLKALEVQLSEGHDQLKDLCNELESKLKKIDDLHDEITTLRRQLQESQLEAKQAHNQVAETERRLLADIERRTSELNRRTAELENAHETIAKLRTQLIAECEMRNAAETSLAEAQALVDKLRLELSIAKQNSEAQASEFRSKEETYGAKLKSLEAQIEALEKQLGESTATAQQRQSEGDELRSQLRTMTDQFTASADDLRHARDDLATARQRLALTIPPTMCQSCLALYHASSGPKLVFVC